MAGFFKKLGNDLGKATADLLSNSDFVSRTVGMGASYDDLMFIVQSLGREPISLLGKDYMYIYDHVRRNVKQGTDIMNPNYDDCPKFTFYKEKPTVKFADPFNDPQNLIDAWFPDYDFMDTSSGATFANGMLYSYAESSDDAIENRVIVYDIKEGPENSGVKFGQVGSIPKNMSTCDLIAKTNALFNKGKYRTLISRFHTNSQDSKNPSDIKQTAITRQHGMSHGRNLLKKEECSKNNPWVVHGYDNPYCRVWTHHHQYKNLSRMIRPFCEESGEANLEKVEKGGYPTVGFRTIEDKLFDFKGGSERLDDYGTLNRNGFVNIAPTMKIKDYFYSNGTLNSWDIPIKKCMFSIENLAWKSDNVIMKQYDEFGLSPEQKGPLGGRIMWFPPYDLTFSEDVSVDWNANQFIGRGEKVYTYTNTERKGNLSFTLLIDHPSILDYWTGHERNGKSNKGKGLDTGNNGGVDEVDNQENTLLRFFAGCDILTAKPQEFISDAKQKEKNNDVAETKDVKEDPPPPDVHEPKVTAKKIHCVLYYPNNYSGVDDAPSKGGSTVNAVHYLVNGVGTQKEVKVVTNETADIPTTIKSSLSINRKRVGGYEMGNGGVSVVDGNLSTNIDEIKKSFPDGEENKSQYLTNSNGEPLVLSYDNDDLFNPITNSPDLAKIIGSEAMSLASANGTNLTGSSHLWYRRRWYYRIDKEYENQQLSNKDSYLDLEDFKLNADGYTELEKNEEIYKAFGLDKSDENTKLISFADLFVALEGSDARELLRNKYTEENVSIVTSIIEDTERFKITSIKFEGHASKQGYSRLNSKLSDNRAMTFKKWMQEKGFPDVDEASVTSKKASENNNVDKGGNSTLETKLWRSASVIIEYDETEIINASTAEGQTFATDEEGNVVKDADGKPLQQTVKMEVPNGLTSVVHMAPVPSAPIISSKSWNEEFQGPSIETQKSFERSMIDIQKRAGFNTVKQEYEYDKKYGNIDVKTVTRYDNEGEFFEQLGMNDPFLHHLITEKIRYFDPAFHSISPEGFNARLTFLHQCTRQGSTVGSSDTGKNTAYNLSFGRPPVCVLRLGDFYYTKIIINSISIQYETPQWDLNPEGIGVMPMFAKINMNFVFLGGSDLAGPIARLQNAVSFNYYANTSVYDNRAEMVEYDTEGRGKETKFRPFSYPDMLYQGRDKLRKTNIDISKPIPTELV